MKVERRKAKYCLITIAALAVALLAQPALAVTTKWWVGPNPNTLWTTSNNWSLTQNGPGGAGQPGLGENALLISTTGSKSATLNTVTSTLGLVEVDASPTGTFTVNENSGAYALNCTVEIIGFNGNGVYNQTAGSNTANDSLNLGFFSGSTGTYNQSGGSTTVTINLELGASDGSTGTYNKSGGSLTVGYIRDGLGGTGFFNQSSGGVTVNHDLFLGEVFNSSTGTYKMSSGTLSVGGDETIGLNGTGTFTQSSGSHTIGGNLYVGRDAGSTGTFTQSSGSLLVTNEIIGGSGTGTFTQSSGSHSIGLDLTLGGAAGATGTYTMTSGSLSVGGFENIGFAPGSTGTFTQTSGSHTVNKNFTLGLGAGATGTYTMTSGSLTVKGAGGEVIGNFGTGTFTQTSGSNTVTNGKLVIAREPGSHGTYNLNSGSVNVPNAALDAIHVNGPFSGTIPSTTGGNFNVTGGATVNGNVTNDGLVKTTGANVTWNGTFTNNKAYISDPSTQTFTGNFIVNPSGFVIGNAPLAGTFPTQTAQDLFIFKNDFTNMSTQNTTWFTQNAGMQFVAGASNTHNLYIPGIDNGRTAIPNNFNWYSLSIGTGQTLDLFDGNTSNASTALYVGQLLGVTIVGANVTNIVGSSNPADPTYIYYDDALTANSYLGGLDYAFATGYGGIKFDANPDIGPNAIPLPPSVLLLGSGLLGLGALGWRRKRA